MRCKFHESTNVKYLGILSQNFFYLKPVQLQDDMSDLQEAKSVLQDAKSVLQDAIESSQVRFAGIQIALATRNIETNLSEN